MNTTILTMSTARHRDFAKTLQSELSKYCRIHATSLSLDEDCEGDFHSSNFFNACYNKICNIVCALEKKQLGDVLIYLDADICVRGDIASAMIDELGDSHIAFQRDSSVYCAGMFVCKACPEVLNFFKTVRSALIENKEYYVDRTYDQGTINELLPHSGLRYSFLSDRFTTYGNIAHSAWSPNSAEFELDSSVLAFHANYTKGLENKKALLAYIRSI